MDEADEVIGDICRRLIEGDMMGGQEWRPAATLDFLIQGMVTLTQDSTEPIKAAVAKDLLGDILLSLTYLELDEPDEEQELFDKQWDNIVQRIMRPDQNEEEE
jgi:hypothetical protein